MVYDLKCVDSEALLPQVESPVFECAFFSLNEREFSMDVKEVAKYYVREGKEIQYSAYPNADQASIELYLEGSALGALLHQRGDLPFHGSSFLYQGKGILVCGHSGAGKSSTTMAFCAEGALLVNDDISPVKLIDNKVVIMPVKTKIKLWDNALAQLKIPSEGLQKIRPDMEKFYFQDVEKSKAAEVLDHVIILATHNQPEYEVSELSGVEKYNALRRQIYRKVYLKGMPQREREYFKEMLQLANKIKVTRVLRPQKAKILETQSRIKAIIEQ